MVLRASKSTWSERPTHRGRKALGAREERCGRCGQEGWESQGKKGSINKKNVVGCGSSCGLGICDHDVQRQELWASG